MARLSYLDFELQIEREGDHYRAEVLKSPVGETSGVFLLPFTEEGLELLILRLGARGGRKRGIFSDELGAARELGGKLFEAVFTGDLRACLRSSLFAAESRDGIGLRVKLRFQDVGELANLPWEYLYDASVDQFLAQSDYTPLVRYVEMQQEVRPLAVQPPIRVLVMASSPDDPDYAQLDIDGEKERLEAALGPLIQIGTISLHWMEKATLAELQRVLRNNVFHILHFIGHGGFERQSEQGVLVLESQLGRAQLTPAHQIGPLLHDHRSLRLVLLNSCEGARHSRDDPFSSIASSFIRQGIPAVVAMQFEISDRSAVTFASGFYSALSDGFPVDAAVAEGRKAILVQPNDVEWATPVLFMRSPDGVLFELASATNPVVVSPALVALAPVPEPTTEAPLETSRKSEPVREGDLPLPGPAALPVEVDADKEESGPQLSLTGESIGDRGVRLLRLREFGEAIQAFNDSLVLSLEDADVLNNRGLAFHELGKNEEALDDLNLALQCAPENAVIQHNRAKVLQSLAQYEAALNDFNRAEESRPDDPILLNNRGLALQQLLRFDEAISDFSRSLAIMPDVPVVLNNRALAFQQSGHYAEAKKDYERSLQLDPVNVPFGQISEIEHSVINSASALPSESFGAEGIS